MTRRSGRTAWLAMLACLVAIAGVLTSCERRSIEIEGLAELASEVRSQRLAIAQQQQQQPAQAPPAGAQIQLAMTPLREVLGELTTSQRELSARQAVLTQEMQRWTKMLAESMQSTSRADADKMAERLAQLEQTIAEQDVRHRKVEQLLGAALDRTADQLEEFLKRVGAEVTPVDVEAGSADETKVGETKAPASGGAAEPSVTPPEAATEDPGAGGGQATAADSRRAEAGLSDASARRGSAVSEPHATAGSVGVSLPAAALPAKPIRWLWWTATGLSLIAGMSLLIGCFMRRGTRHGGKVLPAERAFVHASDSRQLAVLDDKSAGLFSDADVISVDAVAPLPPTEPAMDPAVAWEPPVSPPEQIESWPAAPLPPSPPSPPGNPGHLLEPLGMATGDDDATDDAPQIEELWAAAAMLGEAIGRLKQGDDDVVAGQPHSAESTVVQADGAHPHDAIGDDAVCEEFFVIDESDFELQDQLEDASEHAERCLQGVDESTLPGAELAQPTATPKPAATPITCRLFVRADIHGAARLRRVLGADPRVLAHPAPEVHSQLGEAEVSYAMLPGLPPGERSVLEQKLRDTVA